jgi:hypothetical protein
VPAGQPSPRPTQPDVSVMAPSDQRMHVALPCKRAHTPTASRRKGKQRMACQRFDRILIRTTVGDQQASITSFASVQ